MTHLAGTGRRSLRLFVLVLLGVAFRAGAVDSLHGKVGSITSEDWTISGLEVVVDFSGSQLQGDLRIGVLEVPAAKLSFSDVLARCHHIEFASGEFGCLSAQFAVTIPGVGRETFSGDAFYQPETGTTRFTLRDIPLAHGLLALRGTATDTSVDLEMSGSNLQMAELAGIASKFGTIQQTLSAAGTVDLSGSLRLRDGEAAGFELKAALADASVSNNAGTIVTDAMRARFDVAAERVVAGWEVIAGLTADAGEAYVEPVYANFGENKLTFGAEGRVTDDLNEFELRAFAIKQGSLIDAAGRLHIRLPQSDSGEVGLNGSVELRDSSVEAIYSGLLQVLLAGTIAGDLETVGTVAGTVTFSDGVVSAADLSLRDVGADDRDGRVAVYGLNGEIHWPGPDGEAGDAEPTRLAWDSASAYAVQLEAGEIVAALGGDDLRLLEKLTIPTMGGALVINRLFVENYGKPDASGLLDAELEPIQLGQLTGAFGWPAFSGTLSGQLPLMQYDGDVMTVGGTLSANAFGGSIEFANLRLEQPFGLVPRLYGDLRLRQLDLEQVTDTFSFGLIQGRLSGDVTGLAMLAWQPVAMDLHLYTPAGDSSRRRISQRAVENLASVGGGGAAAALSSGFMKFFEEFSYEKIGIRCILKDGICRMSGAGAAGASEFGQGYYIVKGSGLPRIDVVGYRHQVSWSGLVRQLVSITESGPPIVN